MTVYRVNNQPIQPWVVSDNKWTDGELYGQTSEGQPLESLTIDNEDAKQAREPIKSGAWSVASLARCKTWADIVGAGRCPSLKADYNRGKLKGLSRMTATEVAVASRDRWAADLVALGYDVPHETYTPERDGVSCGQRGLELKEKDKPKIPVKRDAPLHGSRSDAMWIYLRQLATNHALGLWRETAPKTKPKKSRRGGNYKGRKKQ